MTQETTSLRLVATTNPICATANHSSRKFRATASAGAIAISAMFDVLAGATPIRAETVAETEQAKPGSQLPPIEVTAPEAQRNANSAPARADRGGQRRRTQTARRPEQPPAAKPFALTQDARTGTVGYYSDSTGAATKTNTPLAADQRSAVGHRPDQGLHFRSGHP
jgi:catecholate siderophore receptor